MKISDCLVISRKKNRDEPILTIERNENAVIERNIFISEPLSFWQRLKYLLFNDPLWKSRIMHSVRHLWYKDKEYE